MYNSYDPTIPISIFLRLVYGQCSAFMGVMSVTLFGIFEFYDLFSFQKESQDF